MASIYEHSNEPAVFMKCTEFLGSWATVSLSRILFCRVSYL